MGEAKRRKAAGLGRRGVDVPHSRARRAPTPDQWETILASRQDRHPAMAEAMESSAHDRRMGRVMDLVAMAAMLGAGRVR